MDKLTYIRKIKNTLSRIYLPYYAPEKINIEYSESMVITYLYFCLPFASIRNIIKLCEVNGNMFLAFDGGRAELSEYHPKDKKKFIIPRMRIK